MLGFRSWRNKTLPNTKNYILYSKIAQHILEALWSSQHCGASRAEIPAATGGAISPSVMKSPANSKCCRDILLPQGHCLKRRSCGFYGRIGQLPPKTCFSSHDVTHYMTRGGNPVGSTQVLDKTLPHGVETCGDYFQLGIFYIHIHIYR